MYQNQYTQPAYPASYSPPSTNGKAIASLILSLFGISLLAVIFGHLAQTEIRKSQGRQSGEGLAIVGLVFGWLGMAGWLLLWIVIFSAAAFY
jgi:VIT1/CCC1 family predicted Fe2+/Mn2+ transporter